MKQTAVEWLYKALLLDEDNPNYNQRVVNQAKEMEYYQNKYFYDNAFYQGRCTDNDRTKSFEYYNETFKEKKIKDTIVESVIKQFKDRSDVGIAKYGVTLDRTDLSALEWINHAQQEAMDFCLYLERLKQEFNNQKSK